MSRDSGLLRLVAYLYDVPHVPSGWDTFLQSYTAHLGANVGALQVHRFDQGTSEILASFGVASPLRRSYNAHYAPLNVFREKGRHLYQPAAVLFDEQICSRTTLERSIFFNEFLVPLGAVYSASGVIERTAEHALVITALRDRSHEQWNSEDLAVIDRLLPHVTHARTMERWGQLLAASLGALDTLDVGIVLVRAPADIVYANRHAEAIATRADGVSLASRTLQITDAAADARLRLSILAATATAATADHGAPITAPRRSLARPYQLMVSPLRHGARTMAGLPVPHAMIVIIDPEHQRPISPRVFESLYGLTRREAALAEVLSRGESLQTAAAKLGMRYETARSHLRRVFDKTGTSRQSELVVLLTQLSSVASRPPDP
ncbi:MAG TPA: helix-turn-helix transcriptional regulator [Vicinamibacterales bacterium]|nr:helix-turn-helix transcriptional regulator [Vicinamibacterales bacterium]